MVLPFPVCLALAKASKIGKQNNTVEGSPSTVTENQQVAERKLCHFFAHRNRCCGKREDACSLQKTGKYGQNVLGIKMLRLIEREIMRIKQEKARF